MNAPQDFEQLRSALAETGQGLPRRLRQVADFVVQHPDEVALGTTSSVAKRAGVQASTLVRFAQTFGFAGFTEMQGVLRAHLRNRLPDYPQRLRALRAESQAKDGAPRLLAGFAEAAVESLRSLRESVQGRDLENAFDRLAKARTIYLSGQRRSFGVAHYLAYVLAKMQVNAVLVDSLGGLGPEQIASIGPSDALIGVSVSPYAPLTLEAAAVAKQAGASLIVITDGVLSPLAQIADVRFDVVEKDFAAFRTQAATLCLATTLAVGLAERRAALEVRPKRRI